MNAILQGADVVAGIWGALWFLWDKYADAPGWLLGTALVCLIAGGLLS